MYTERIFPRKITESQGIRDIGFLRQTELEEASEK